MLQELADPLSAAACVLRRLGIAASPVPLERIAKLCAAAVRLIRIEERMLGTFSLKDGIATIGVNMVHNLNRQRFAIAHGLGHLEMHRGFLASGRVELLRCPIPRWQPEAVRLEMEANQFAAALLMPGELIDYEELGAVF